MLHCKNHVNWKTVEEDGEYTLKSFKDMESSLDQIEKILIKVGTFRKVPDNYSTWYGGWTWFVKLKTRTKVILQIVYSNKMWDIRACRGEPEYSENGHKHNKFHDSGEHALISKFQGSPTDLQELETRLKGFKSLFV